MVQEAQITIDNDSYLIIVYGKDKNKVKAREYDVKVAEASKNLLNTALKSTVAKVALAGLTSPIAQNIAGKALSNATLGRINSSLYDIMADGKITKAEVAEDFIGSCTNTIDNMATDMGLPTPSALYGAIMPSGTGVISKDIVNLFSKKSDKENKEQEAKLNQGDITVLKFKIVTNDSESWAMDIPTRKTEAGFEIATAISNNNKTKNFDVILNTNSRKGTDMYQLKNQLEEIRNKKEPFDIYINDKDVLHQYKMTNCLFSGLDFETQGKNTLKCSMAIVEIPEWNVDFVKLEKTTSTTPKSSSKTKSGIKVNKSSVVNAVKTATKTSTGKAFLKDQQEIDWFKRQIALGKDNAFISQKLKGMGLNFSEKDVADMRTRY